MKENVHSTVARRNMILKQLAEDGQIFIEDLIKKFNVSGVTIRNDLANLEAKRLLIRARGGAMKFEGKVGTDHEISEKDKINFEEKRAIGKKAASLITNSDVIIVDSGTTTAELVKNLDHLEDLTVITNALNIAMMLVDKPNINLIIPGGMMRKNSQSLVGPMAEKSLKNFCVDKVFLGVNGIDPENGFYTPNIEEAYLNEQMIKISKETIVLADSSKFNVKSLTFICPINGVDKIITDSNIRAKDKEIIENQGVEVLIS